jgi:HPt (histidine-containing phosphotransfer) domain-containing protein
MTTDPGLPNGSGAPFDFERLAEVSGDDPEFERELLSDYLTQANALIAECERACASGDATGLRIAGHTLKGSSGTVGAVALAASCAVLESVGTSGDLAGAPVALARARTDWARTQSVLNGHLRGGASRRAG